MAQSINSEFNSLKHHHHKWPYIVALCLIAIVIVQSIRAKEAVAPTQEVSDIEVQQVIQTEDQRVLEEVQPVDGSYTVGVKEADLNYLLSRELDSQPPSDNPVIEATISLQEDLGILRVIWNQGQVLTADVIVDETQIGLEIQNAQVTGAGILNGVMEVAATKYIEQLMGTLTQTEDFEDIAQLEISPGQLRVYYSF